MANKKQRSKPWQKTQTANLWGYFPSGGNYVRVKVRGKLRVENLRPRIASLIKKPETVGPAVLPGQFYPLLRLFEGCITRLGWLPRSRGGSSWRMLSLLG